MRKFYEVPRFDSIPPDRVSPQAVNRHLQPGRAASRAAGASRPVRRLTNGQPNEWFEQEEKGDVTTSLFQIGWPSGSLTLRYTGLQKVSDEASGQIEDAMRKFSGECQMLLIWFAGILGSQDALVSDLMADLRHLRNWLVHRNATTEDDFFKKSKILPGLLRMQRMEPSLTANKVSLLMQRLNRMQVDVNPLSLPVGLEPTPLDVEAIAGVARTLKSGSGMDIPATASMHPTAVYVVFNEGPAATVHEIDCTQKDAQFRSVDGGPWIRVTSSEIARRVIKTLGKTECPCEHCRG